MNQYWSLLQAVLVRCVTTTGSYHVPLLVARVTSSGSFSLPYGITHTPRYRLGIKSPTASHLGDVLWGFKCIGSRELTRASSDAGYASRGS